MSKVTIPVRGLNQSVQHFEFQVDKSFVEEFGTDLLKDVDCKVVVAATHRGELAELECEVEGSATVECDRCLDNLVLPVEVSDSFVVREVAVYDGDKIDEADNVLIIDESETDINLDQCVYDMICCSLPLQKVHNDGECNPEMIARLHQAVEENAAGGNSPFSALKDMLNNK